MMDISLSLNGDSTSLDVIKYCALYFDHISLDTPFDIHTIISSEVPESPDIESKHTLHFLPLYDINLNSHIEMLKKEGILTHCNPMSNVYNSDLNVAAKDIVASQIIKHFTPGTISKITTKNNSRNIRITGKPEALLPEMIESFNNIFFEEALNDLIEYKLGGHADIAQFYCLLVLYSFLLNDVFCHICSGKNVASNSEFLNNLIEQIYSTTNKTSNFPKLQIALNALAILLPNIKDANMEDILNIRFHATDELLELRNYIDELANDFSTEKIQKLSPQEIQNILNQKIVPAINQFERKMENMKISAAQKFVKNLANPLYYAPLLTTFFTNLSVHQTLLASLGIITTDSIMEYKKNKNSIKNDPLYFSIKLKNL